MIKQKIYIIQRNSDRRIKIGISKDPVSRIKQLQCGSACQLELIYQSKEMTNAKYVESAVHKSLSGRLCGEWFNCSVDVAITTIENNLVFSENLTPIPISKAPFILQMVVDLRDERMCAAGIDLALQMNEPDFKESQNFILRMLITLISGSDYNYFRCMNDVDMALKRFSLIGFGKVDPDIMVKLKDLKLGFEI